MSFILDALRKSDLDRQRAAVPGVQTMHAPHIGAANKHRFWPYVLLAAGILAGIALFQWIKPQSDPVAMTQEPMHQPEKIAAPKHRQSVLPVSAPEPSPTSVASDQPETEESRATSGTSQPIDPLQAREIAAGEEAELEEPVEWIAITPQAPADTPQDIAEAVDESIIPNVHALPPSVQRQLPAIAIAAQIYDTDPASRMAIINGRSVREGGIIAPDLILETVGENGIILNFQGQRFQMDVFQNWLRN